MVKSETFFCRLVSIDALISFDGIVPSASDFQLKLISLIEQFSKALLIENQDPTESEALCRILCCYFDQRLTCNERSDMLRWQRYSLERYFYGYDENTKDVVLSIQLEVLLCTESEMLFSYAWRLLMLLRQIEQETDRLVSLRTANRARYFSRERLTINRASAHTEDFLAQHAEATIPQLMVLIIGPFANKWFKQFDLSTSHHGRVIWVVAEHAQTLLDRLIYKDKKHPGLALRAFFPVLADGFENSSIMIEQLMAWQQAFASLQLTEPLSCLLGFYTRLSQQRYSHDPDKAIWTGELTCVPAPGVKLESSIANLISDLAARDDGNDLYAIQRHALGSTLIAWLAEKRIISLLQNFFDSTKLELSGVTLADHGLGFTRHGAWSLWLAEKYGILPGLSASIAMPPLPEVLLPPPIDVKSVPISTPQEIYTPLYISKRRWPKTVMLLALFTCVATGIAYYSKRQIREISAQQGMFGLPEEVHKRKTTDMETSFSMPAAVPLFEKGSSNLAYGSEKVLEALIPKMAKAPNQMYLIIGYADNTGSPALNQALSTERAFLIRHWLTEHSGLPASNFIVEGAGNSRPIASNDTKEGRALNRRVEIIPLPVQSN